MLKLHIMTLEENMRKKLHNHHTNAKLLKKEITSNSTSIFRGSYIFIPCLSVFFLVPIVQGVLNVLTHQHANPCEAHQQLPIQQHRLFILYM